MHPSMHLSICYTNICQASTFAKPHARFGDYRAKIVFAFKDCDKYSIKGVTGAYT